MHQGFSSLAAAGVFLHHTLPQIAFIIYLVRVHLVYFLFMSVRNVPTGV